MPKKHFKSIRDIAIIIGSITALLGAASQPISKLIDAYTLKMKVELMAKYGHDPFEGDTNK
jgi:hypothetical protein